MSIINGTLIVQAFHFYIGFLIVKHILFKPAVTHIQAQDTLHESLITTIQEYQRTVVSLEQEATYKAAALRTYFAINAPQLTREPLPLCPSLLVRTIPLETQELTRQSKEVAAHIVPRMDHVA
jgi:hypothetical protein